MNDRLDRAIRSATADIVAAAPTPPSDPVTAARQRRKAPFWAMTSLALMPVFGFIYVRALTDDGGPAEGPLAAGAELYSSCATCHGAQGGGVEGQGYQLADGEVLATFPNIEDQLRFVYYGTDRYRLAGVDIAGDPNRVNGPHRTGERGAMPPFGSELTVDEIIAVVCHERFTLGGADPTSDAFMDEYEAWCSPEAPVYAAVAAGELDLVDTELESIETDDDSIAPIGTAPIPGR